MDKDGEITVGIDAYYDQSTVLLAQDQDVLLPAWRQLATAISSSNKSGIITLCVRHIELGKEVLDMLLNGPLKKLILTNNNLFESGGVSDFVSVLEANSSLESLSMFQNLIKREEDAQSLVNAVINHPKLDFIMLDRCDLGCNESVMKSIVPLLGSLDKISLDGNQIGS